MSRYEFDAVRLFIDLPLAEGASAALDRTQANYLTNVMRLGAGDRVLVFNGRDGEFEARLDGDRKRVSLTIGAKLREQTLPSPVRFLFAPLKHARLDYLVEKAVELGAGTIEPVMTQRTQASRVNLERMQANIIEAAEQCGILSVPRLVEPSPLARRLAGFEAGGTIVFCDEDAPVADPVAALKALTPGAVAVVIGPEGGFDPKERQMLMSLPGCVRLSLGPRILRADTAAMAALTLVQAVLGDWVHSDY
jgi:16S rRNA (uracil1498-N3)-methyltransferase